MATSTHKAPRPLGQAVHLKEPGLRLVGCVLTVGLLAVSGCEGRLTTGGAQEGRRTPEAAAGPRQPQAGAPSASAGTAAGSENVPCTSDTPDAAKSAAGDVEDIPRYAANSPFSGDVKVPQVKEEKRLWADSFLWAEAPELVVETWLTDKPDTKGKYVLIEFWNTWCPPCRRSLAHLNRFHEKYGKELVVIGVCDEKPETVRNFKTHKIEFYSAIDTKARTKKEFGVFGVPHAVILEPERYVIWEGFPLLKGYELTDEIIEKILAVGRREKAKAKAKAEAERR